ncbi:MAG: GntR family transcriptional regulator [Pseudomonadota bacterium]|nr:GntR family transcriptional regulator [Pseudomonadota bacterium]
MTDAPTHLYLGPLSPASGPLYQQIVDGIKREVLADRLTAGSALPSYRVLAEKLLVSLITVKRAYEELEREGITFSRQGLGTFVAASGNDRTRADRRAVARDALRSAIHSGRQAGVTDRELIQMLRDELKSQLTESNDEPIRGSAP